ncbi:MAG TPA: type III polyketide synthase [Gammaproteobacteria bacterium]|nr:type III polyketide synthase [Gammaproteobacteria bacterium]
MNGILLETLDQPASRPAHREPETEGAHTGRLARQPAMALLGLGVAAPEATLDQQVAADFAAARCCTTERQANWLRRIYRQSGVRHRASMLLDGRGLSGLEQFYPAEPGEPRGPTTAVRLQRYANTAGALGERACRVAFAEAGIDRDTITHLVTVSCTGLMSPGLDAELIERLSLSPDIGRLNLGFMGCHGALNGLRAAQALAASQPDARVLVCCVELCSLHFQYGWDMQKIVANALFADGAGAAIIGPDTGDRNGWRLAATASRLAPDSDDAMTWQIGDHGFKMTLSRDVPKLIRGALHDWLSDWLATHELTVADIAHWAIHPGGPKIIETALESLSLPAEAGAASRAVLAEHGNMSSPTVLFIIERLRAEQAAPPCVALGFGPGLALEAALFV